MEKSFKSTFIVYKTGWEKYLDCSKILYYYKNLLVFKIVKINQFLVNSVNVKKIFDKSVNITLKFCHLLKLNSVIG